MSLTAGTVTTITVGLLTGPFKLMNHHSSKVMEVAGSYTHNGGSVIQYDWSGSLNQQWKLLPDYDGSFRLSNVNSGRLLDNPGSSTTTGWNQEWQLVGL